MNTPSLADFRRRWPQPPPIVTSVYLADRAKLEPALDALCALADQLAQIHPGILLQLADEQPDARRAGLVRKLIQREDGVEQHYWTRSNNEEQSEATGEGEPDEPLRQVSAELVFGEGSPHADAYPLSDLAKTDYEKAHAITREVLDNIIGVSADETGVTVMNAWYGPGGYAGNPPTPSGQIEVRGTAEQVSRFAALIGLMAQQTEVWVTRADPSGNAEAINILSSDLDFWNDHNSVRAFWNKLRSQLPKRTVEGFQPLYVLGEDGSPDLAGIRIIKTPDPENSGRIGWSEEQHNQIQAAARRAGQSLGLTSRDSRIEKANVQLERYENDWTKHRNGDVFRQRLGAARQHSVQASHLDHLVARSRRWIEQAFQTHAPEELRAHRAARKREADLSELDPGHLNRLVQLLPRILGKANDIQRRWPEPPTAFQTLYLDQIHALLASINSLATAGPPDEVASSHIPSPTLGRGWRFAGVPSKPNSRKEPSPCLSE